MPIYKAHRMLVTGGAGFIGSNFIYHVLLQEPEIHIINLDKLTYAGSLENLKHLPHQKRHEFIQGDIRDTRLVQQILEDFQIDTIVHFAAESHVDRSISSPAAFMETNVIGTFVLLEAARQFWMRDEKNMLANRFHHVSTDEVYGTLNLHDAAFSEKTPYAPRSPYSASKAGSDHLVSSYYHTYGLPITLSHCSNNYGPHQHTEKFIPTIIYSCLEGKPIPVYGNGKNRRDWLYVDDHVKAVMKILKEGKEGHHYNIGGSEEWENIALAYYICERLDELRPKPMSYTTLLQYVTDRPGHDFRYAIDTSKIKNELGWSPKETFTSGMEKTIQFYLRKLS